jgi:hypothetical protein
MAETSTWREFLDGARVDDAVFTLRPDYRVLLLAVDGLTPGDARLAGAERLPGWWRPGQSASGRSVGVIGAGSVVEPIR